MSSNLTLVHSPLLTQFSTLVHATTTRVGGHSNEPFQSLNMSLTVGDALEAVLSNRTMVLETLALRLDDLVVCEQTHSGNVNVVSNAHSGRGAYDHGTSIPNCDALTTVNSGVCLMVLAADCSPIVIYDPDRRAIAAVHAGRAGSEKRILTNTVQVMRREFGCDVKNLHVAIGPSIGGNHYSLSSEKALRLSQALPSGSQSLRREGDTFWFDLQTAHLEELHDLDVSRDNISVYGGQTFEQPSLFFSERRDRAPTGRFASIIALA